VFSPLIFWMWFAGLIFLTFGLISVRKQLSLKLDNIGVLGRVFVASSLALFGAEHLAEARLVVQVVPAWMPGRLLWTYFVGIALLAASTSIVLMKYVRLSASLLGLMFFLFVVMIHVPNVAMNPGDRIIWAVALRDLAFAAGAWTLAGTQMEKSQVRGAHRLIAVSRMALAAVLVFFAVEHFLHPEFAPGVPLAKLTPAWIPVRPLWGYFTGAVLLVAGAAILFNRGARAAVTCLGIVISLLVLIIYVPLLPAATQSSGMTEALNYIADTLLFGGTVLVVAAALPTARTLPAPLC
jgi:uncharacterized membrane protein